MPLREWFMSLVKKCPDGCWIWTGNIQHKRWWIWIALGSDRQKKVRAHHFLVPKLPSLEEADGVKMEYDHLCGVPACVNPDHLEMVTASENREAPAQTPLIVPIVE